MSRTLQPVPRWAVWASWILSFVGLALAIYLTYEHFSQKVFQGCGGLGSTFNCQKVTTSAQSRFLGVPVAVLGLANFVIFVVINSPWVWKVRYYGIHLARFVLTLGGMAFVLWLLYAELFIIGNLCLYCTGVHVVTFALFVVLVRVCPAQLGWASSASE